jgi:2-desacetyl-2-hydroxyethyl bacteriochlorophyllide A dehydrogenase
VREEPVPEPASGEVLVATEVSAISAGTELLLYRGQLDPETMLDDRLPSLQGRFHYPVRYGYAASGRVVELGRKAPAEYRGRRVFAFQPHGSHFAARPEDLHLLPGDMTAEVGSLLPTIETAVSLVLDGRPLLGERVLVMGQGVVGLVTVALLARFPLGRLVTVDRWEARRRLSIRLGAETAVAPEELQERDFDLVFEISGSPEALNLAIAAAGFEARIVVGSWYGEKRAPIDLGTHFHRRRLGIVSSQVSHLGPHLLARWTKGRRLDAAQSSLSGVPLDALVTHRFPIERAAEAYRLLDESPENCLQVLLTYT